MTASPRPAPSPLFRLAIDFGPLAVFFLVNGLSSRLPLPPGFDALGGVLLATGAFMIATFVAMLVSQWRTGHISPMLWMSGALVLVFGGLTLYFHDATFIKVKPTIVYAMFAAVLAFGLATGRPLLQQLLEAAYPGLTEAGWRRLTINWMLFFVVMAVLNEAVWRTQSWDFWVGYKLWGAMPLTLLFALANVPMLMRHGLTTGEATEAALPPEQ